ncbi:hypothetical protein [uncultured Sneathiella sp.]|uniref:hypothetical protein n=1 Tax=uncultured Sneathiella sp. TaxID=879315 RepID=UPI0030DC7218|tara:strand:- start:3082 stop:4038 length:957 start_codon:yes stop_codon:yes gene_type:complete
MMTLPKWVRVVLIFLPCFVLLAPQTIAGDEALLIQELEQHRHQILSRIEELKGLKTQSERSLNRAKAVHGQAKNLNDEAALQVARQAISKATAALDDIRNELQTERGNLVRINHFLDRKEKISFSNLKTRVLVKKVPNPMQMPRGSWLRYVEADRAALILDALEEKNGDLDGAIDYLDRQIIKFGGNRNSESALSYLEGLRTSYIAANAEYRRQNKGDGAPVSIESKSLMDAILRESGPYEWPGPKNPNPGDKPLNRDDWRIQRAEKMLSALGETPNDLGKTYQSLEDDRDIFAAANAKNYLKGAFAYWDYLSVTGEK